MILFNYKRVTLLDKHENLPSHISWHSYLSPDKFNSFPFSANSYEFQLMLQEFPVGNIKTLNPFWPLFWRPLIQNHVVHKLMYFQCESLNILTKPQHNGRLTSAYTNCHNIRRPHTYHDVTTFIRAF